MPSWDWLGTSCRPVTSASVALPKRAGTRSTGIGNASEQRACLSDMAPCQLTLMDRAIEVDMGPDNPGRRYMSEPWFSGSFRAGGSGPLLAPPFEGASTHASASR